MVSSIVLKNCIFELLNDFSKFSIITRILSKNQNVCKKVGNKEHNGKVLEMYIRIKTKEKIVEIVAHFTVFVSPK